MNSDAPASVHAWTLEELRRALHLRFGPARRGAGPDTAAAAAGIGISRRQLERWLAGAATPSPASAAALRAALAPPVDVLRREVDEARYAGKAAAALARSRRGINTEWKDRQWHHPHWVLVMHHPDLSICRVAVVRKELPKPRKRLPKRRKADPDRQRNDAVRVKPRPASTPGNIWAIVHDLEVPNRFAGVQIRHRILGEVEGWRVQVRRELMPVGGSQVWLDTAPDVDLQAFARA